MKRIRLRNDYMEAKCREAGCNEEKMTRHVWDYVIKKWDWHPPAEFLAWFQPHSFDEKSGASIGGHAEARHTVARKVPSGWQYLEEGTGPVTAWNTRRLRDEYYAWLDMGSPERKHHDYIWLAASLAEQKAMLTALKETVDRLAIPGTNDKRKPERKHETRQTEYEPIDFA